MPSQTGYKAGIVQTSRLMPHAVWRCGHRAAPHRSQQACGEQRGGCDLVSKDVGTHNTLFQSAHFLLVCLQQSGPYRMKYSLESTTTLEQTLTQ